MIASVSSSTITATGGNSLLATLVAITGCDEIGHASRFDDGVIDTDPFADELG